ncbi:MAG: hypothetical protein JXC35_02060 [Acholeplasmataceae bacterium]|nr:hypothetical protein [Acholeplasmataceae bacterium]
MKKFVIGYIFISLLFALALYFTTLTLSYNERVYEIFQSFSEEAVINQNFDDFVGYQSIEYQKIDQIETERYLIFVYHIIGTEESGYTNQLGFFVLPKSDVKHATVIDDTLDQTKMSAMDVSSSQVIYYTTTEKSYEEIAVSYGIEKIGYYFYTFNITQNMTLSIQLYDYDGILIEEIEQAFEYQDYPNVDSSFIKGISQEDIQVLVDQETYIYPKLIKNMTIFIVIDVLLGSALYFFIKYKKTHI